MAFWFYGAAVVAGTGYALLLEWLQRRFKILPYWTEAEVIGGLALMFVFAHWRVQLGVPWLSPEAVATWMLWQLVHILLAIGTPITIWQGWRIVQSYQTSLSTFITYFWKDS